MAVDTWGTSYTIFDRLFSLFLKPPDRYRKTANLKLHNYTRSLQAATLMPIENNQ